MPLALAIPVKPQHKKWLWGGIAGAALLVALWKRKELSAMATGAVKTLYGVTDSAKWAVSLYGVISQELPQLSVSGKLLMIAHGAQESGWGQKAAAARGTNNIWNITAGSQWKGPVDVQTLGDLSYDVNECEKKGLVMVRQKDGGLACRITQTWRKYATVNEAVRDYWDFLGNQNARKFLPARNALERGNAVDFAAALGAAKYYTLPVAQYTSGLLAVVDSVKKRLPFL